MANLWFYCALTAALLWGFSYALSEKVLKDAFNPLFIMVVTGAIYFSISLVAAYFTDNLKSGFAAVEKNPKALINLTALAISYVAGAFLIYYAISLKNATLVNLMEISYPIFTLIFAYILMREVQINLGTLIGGLMVMGGVVVIYMKA